MDTLSDIKMDTKCNSCVKCTVKSDILKNIEEQIPMYLCDGKTYRKCTKTKTEDSIFCHSHKKMENPILFTDIIDNGKRVETNDPILKKKGNGGRKSSKSTFNFSSNNVVLQILNSNDREKIDSLERFCNILNNITKENKDELEYTIEEIHRKFDIKRINWTTDSDNSEHEPILEKQLIQSSITEKDITQHLNDINHSDEEELVPKQDIFELIEELGDDIEDDIDEEELGDDIDEEEKSYEIECEEIDFIKKYKDNDIKLCHDPKTKIVYDMDGNEMGILVEIHEKYHTIRMNDTCYTIIRKSENGEQVCFITNNVFHPDGSLIGKMDENGNIKKKNKKPIYI